VIAWAAVFAWRSPEGLPTPAGYEDAVAPRMAPPVSDTPTHVVRLEAGSGGAVLLFGARHSRDAEDPQIIEIAKRWAEFEPTLALVEGRLGFLLPGVMDPVAQYGESGAVAALARRSGVPHYTWEPETSAEIAGVVEAVGPDIASAYFITRPLLGQRRFGPHEDADSMAEALIAERGRWPGLDGRIATIEDLDRIWTGAVQADQDWREVDDQWGWPGRIAEAAAAAGHVRDDHLLRLILDAVSRGERVFAVAGTSHALKLEPVLKERIQPGPSGSP